jgi:solute carrier family 24 (sodium/potassium/calcium exchanger), member 6
MKTIKIATYPADILRNLSIPFYTETTWNRNKAAFFPIIASLFIISSQDRILYLVYSSTIFSIPIIMLFSVLSPLIGLLIYCTSKRSVLPDYNILLICVSFVLSVLWICLVCEVMVDLLSFFGVLLNLPVSFLGLTLLAWGNSAGDFYANPAIAKLGMAQTAVTACFAGPLFNTLIGFGISLIVASSDGNVSFHILSHIELLIAGVALVSCTTVTIGLLFINKGKIRSLQGYLSISLYLAFVITLIIYSLV